MFNARLHESIALYRKTVAPIEIDDRDLCMQEYPTMTLMCGMIDDGGEQTRSDAFSPVRLEYGHAPDLACRRQPCRGHRLCIDAGKKLGAFAIESIPFQLFWYVLLVDKNRLAYGSQDILFIGPVDNADDYLSHWSST